MEDSKPHSVRERPEWIKLARYTYLQSAPWTPIQEILDEACNAYDGLLEQFDAAMDCMNYAWTIICNVSEGDWTKQNQEWQDAAARCRDQYHALLGSNPAKRPT